MYSIHVHVYTRASPTDIIARKSARRTKVRGQVGELNGPRAPRQADCRGAAPRRTRRLPREEVHDLVKHDLSESYIVFLMQMKLNQTKN